MQYNLFMLNNASTAIKPYVSTNRRVRIITCLLRATICYMLLNDNLLIIYYKDLYL